MKERFDRSRRAKAPSITAWDWVRVRRPHRDNKMVSHWSQPLQVTRQLGPATYLLNNGSRWHSSRLRRVPAPHHSAGVATPTLPSAWQESPESQAAPRPNPDLPGAQRSPAPDFHESSSLAPTLSLSQPTPPGASFRPVRVCSRPGRFEDFVSTFHV